MAGNRLSNPTGGGPALAVENVPHAPHLDRDAAALRTAALGEAGQLGAAIPDVASAAQRTEQFGPLPGVMAPRLGDRRSEALPQLGLQRRDFLPLVLQAPGIVVVEPKLHEADERGGHLLPL